MAEFAFDVKLFATIRVEASDEATARVLLQENLSAADAHFGAWDHTGEPILAEAVLDDDQPDLIEIDGEAV